MTALALALLLAAPADAERYSFDDRSGEVTFETDSSLHSIHGAADVFSGEVNLDGEAPVTGKLTIQTETINTGLGLRDKRLWGYVLDVNKYPTMSVKLAEVGGDKAGFVSGKGTGSIELLGQMTMRTVERDVSIPCTYTWDGDTVKIEGNWEFLWTDYNLPDPSIPLARMYPDVRAAFSVNAKKRP